MSSAASRAALRAQAATNAEVAAQIKQATFCQATLVSGETCLKIDVTGGGSVRLTESATERVRTASSWGSARLN